ncbi:hypothetical protein ID849_19905, partial [Xenorhabdus sp. 3]|nr:hypothetical protein [Xenorhabdus sp. 3]
MSEERALKRITKVQEINVIEGSTGEILKQETILEGYGEREPDYIKLYIKDIATLID